MPAFGNPDCLPERPGFSDSNRIASKVRLASLPYPALAKVTSLIDFATVNFKYTQGVQQSAMGSPLFGNIRI